MSPPETALRPFAGIDLESALVSECENPHWDPRFSDRWLIDLVSHWGEWRRPRLVAPKARSGELCTVARSARLKAERMGFVIEADERLGYRAVDLFMPDRIYMIKPGRPPRDEPEAPPADQLQLCSGV